METTIILGLHRGYIGIMEPLQVGKPVTQGDKYQIHSFSASCYNLDGSGT